MFRLARCDSRVRVNSRSQGLLTRQDNTAHRRRLRMEPLEDRRMLSVTLFVDADAPTGGDGLGWGSAYQDLQAALEDAGARNADSVGENDVDQIWIAEGVYKPSAELPPGDSRSASFSLLDGVTLYGGFSGTETALEGRDWSAHVTTLSGDLGTLGESDDNAYTVVYCGETIEAVLDGVSIVDGTARGSSGYSRPEQRRGGGIYSAGTLTVANSTLVGNSADYGGGICSTGMLTLTNSVLSRNLARYGGGIYGSGELAVTNSTLSGNTAAGEGFSYGAGGRGGGIYSSGTLTVTDSAISGNWATGNTGDTSDYPIGGGIYSSGTLTVTNSALSGNSAYHGGGIYDSGTLTVTNTTLSGNSAESSGGGIFSTDSASPAALNNTIVAGNLAPAGPDVYHDSATLTGSHNLIGDGSGQSALVHGENGNQIGTSDSPIDPLLSDWSELDNGRWGYYLLSGSPALDAGDNALAVDAAGQPLVEDLSGSPRIQNGTVDIGAVEGTAAGAPAQIYVVTSLDRTVAEDGVLTFLEAFEAASRNQAAGDAPAGSFTESDVIRFAEGLSGTVPVEDGELLIQGDLSIEGPGVAQLTFDAQGANRVFLIGTGVSAGLSGMTITGGLADEGGGIFNNHGTLTLANSTVSENSTSEYLGNGGGIFNSGTLTVTNSTLSENSADMRGGGIHNSGTLTIINSTLSRNSASGEYASGGGICNSGTLTVTNSTLSRNWADSRGGGISTYYGSSTTVLNNTIVAGNAASTRPDIYHEWGALSGSYNLIGNGSGQSTLVDGENGNQVGTSTSPIDPLLSDWTELDNGRPGCYLLPGSPALDAGENALAVDAAGQPLLDDGSGNPRIQNGTVDIGAVEGAALGSPGHVYVVASLDTTIAEDGVLTFSEAFEAANRNQPVGDAPGGSFTEADVIRFAEGLSGTIPVEDGELVIDGNLTIEGPGAAMLAFNGGGTSRLFLITPGAYASLSGMTITGGSADEGGGIYIDHGTLAVTDATLSGNSASQNGGGIYSSDGTLTVTNSTLSENSAVHGGGIHSTGTLTVTDSTLSRNSADMSGGGIYAYNNDGTVTVTGSTLSENSADSKGGGIFAYNNYGVLTVTGSMLSGNSAGYGGGIYTSCRTATVVNSTLSGNSGGYGGGGVYSKDSRLTVANSTLSGNSSDDRGGGVFIDGGSLSTATLNNTIAAGNFALAGADIYRYSGGLSGSHNLIGIGAGQSSLIHGENGNQVGTSTSPIDPLLSDWTELGNARWGYYLLPESPALDAGENALAVDAAGQPLVEDIYSNPRILGGTVDIGSIEGATVADPAQVYVITSLDTTVAEDGILTFPEALEAANRNQPVGDAPAGSFGEADVIRFAEGLNGTISVEDGELAIQGDLSVEGPGAGLLAFDAGGTSRVFLIKQGVSASLNGMTITGGLADSGGGIYCRSASLTVVNSTLSGNSARYGGAITNQAGTLAVTNTTLSGNSAEVLGGGISSRNGTVTVTNSTISQNSARTTGGIWSKEGILTVTNSTISQNCGDGIRSEYGTLTVTNSTIAENDGDGISSAEGPVTVTNSTLWGNDGRGIHSSEYNYDGTLTVTGSTFSGNSDGGIYCEGTLTVTNSTLSGNFADDHGGGILLSHSSTATLNNTIVAGNAAASGPDIYLASGTLTGSHNLIGDGSDLSSLVHGEDGNQVGSADSPIDPGLSDWTELDHGGWGYYILPGSPALDAGDNALAVDAASQPLTEDLFGNERIQNGTVDIGSVEGTTEAGPAQVYLVTSLDMTVADDGVLTFLEAFEAANHNQPAGDALAGSFGEADVIRFAEGLDGTISVENGELVILGDLSIEGPGAELLAFDAGGTSRVFLTKADVSASLSGLTITGGSADKGGGIYNSGTLTLIGSTLSENSANGNHGGGGGVFSLGMLTVADSTLSGNSATGNFAGGGAILSLGTLTVTGSTFLGNSSTGRDTSGGGGIRSFGTTMVTNSTFSGNSAHDKGGAICNFSGTLTVTNSALSGNSANDGGGISNSGTLTVTNSTLSGNSADSNGGGGIYSTSGTVTVTNSTLSRNSANGSSSDGGGIWSSSTLTVTNSTLSGNSADTGGGIGSFGRWATLTLNNSIVARNTASSGPDIYDYNSGPLSGSHNLIGNGSGQSSLVDGVNGNRVGTAEAPIDPRFDDYGDLHLLPDSPAVNAGDNALLPPDIHDLDADGNTDEPVPFDLDGNRRVMGGTVDIGAYEYSPVVELPGDLDADGQVGGSDLDVIRAHWGQTVTPWSLSDGDPSGDGVVSGADLDIVRANWGQSVPTAAAALPAALPAESGAKSSAKDPVYGPARRNESTSLRQQARDALFAGREALAEAAWMDAVEGLQARRKGQAALAVDAALLQWGGE